MARRTLLTAEVAEQLATLAVDSQLLELNIDRYKSGKNKGKHFVEYKEGERILDINSINVLKTIAQGLKQGKEYHMVIILPEKQSMYVSVEGL